MSRDLLQRTTQERQALSSVRALANQAFSRAAGGPLIPGNTVRLLRDAQENYPAWLEAIAGARRHIYFETYLIRDDAAGVMFADALLAKAAEGVTVRLLCDWLGAFGKASHKFWRRLRQGGVEVRCYNPPRWDSPFGWVSRDHRKTISVDGEIGFVTGLCVGSMWLGDPAKKIAPWRDTGVEVRGPAVAHIEQAFSSVWAMTGAALPPGEMADPAHSPPEPEGSTALRVVASLPAMGEMFRVDQMVAALARNRLWLTDAYYAGLTAYVQALRSAAKDGVDVRLLVPNATDIPLLKPLSRAGYRPLLEAGVRIFEWNGAMLHAKTAVADGRWARVGSTNLNIASWFGNCELDVVVEDEGFAGQMEDMFQHDLENSTEVVLDAEQKVRSSTPHPPRERQRGVLTSGGGSVGRAAAGAVRIGNAVAAAFTNRRVLEPVEGRLMVTAGIVLLLAAILIGFFPRILAYPLVLLFSWTAASLLYRGYKLHRAQPPPAPPSD